MFKKGMRVLLAAAAVAPLLFSTAWAEGLMTIIVNDPANPYWFTEGEVAKKTAEGLGYTANVGAHKGDTNTESNLIDTAITNKSPLGAYRGVGFVVSAFVHERVMDVLAREGGLDPAEVRHRNLLAVDEFPYTSITHQPYDSGDYRRALALAIIALTGAGD